MSPIRNLTERRRLPRLGKVHLGIKVDGPKGQYPKPVDYFVCPPAVQEVYGEKPNALEITFVSDDLEACASQWYRAYKQTTGLVCKGNGYTADALLDTDKLKKAGGEITAAVWAGSTSKHVVRQPIDCPGEGFDGNPPCPLYAAKGCKRLMMLQFVVVGVGGIGVWQIDTSSINSIQNVNGFLEMLKTLTNGRVAGIPLTLRLVPHEVAPDGHKKTVHVLELHTDKTMPELLMAGEGPVAQLLLPPPDDELPEDFFPEQAAEPVVGEIVEPEEEALAEALADAVNAHAPVQPEPTTPVQAPRPAPKPASRSKADADALMGRISVMLADYGLTAFELCDHLACQPTQAVAKVTEWVRAKEGRTVRILLEEIREAKGLAAEPKESEQAPLSA